MTRRQGFQVCDDIHLFTSCWIVAPFDCDISLDNEETKEEINESAYLAEDERGTKAKSSIQAPPCRGANHKANGETRHCEPKLLGNVVLWSSVTKEGEANDPNHGRTNTLEDTCDGHHGIVWCLLEEDLSGYER
jgi:hypothetical protein